MTVMRSHMSPATGGEGSTDQPIWPIDNILNPDFNVDLSNWTATGGGWAAVTAISPLTPYEGARFAGRTATAGNGALSQRITVPSRATHITIAAQTALTFGSDEAQFDLQWEDSGLSIISTDSIDFQDAVADRWAPIGYTRLAIPANTATVLLILHAINIGGSNGDVSYDYVYGFWHDSVLGG